MVQVENGSLTVRDKSGIVSESVVWNHSWTPTYPFGGHTRCGTATEMRRDVLDNAPSFFTDERKLAWHFRIQTWDRSDNYSEFRQQERTLFFEDDDL